MTKRSTILLGSFLLAVTLFTWLGMASRVAASASGKSVTLTLGQSQTVKGTGCSLQLTKNTAAQMQVKCKAAPNVVRPSATNAAIVLTAGKSVKLNANGCDLIVTLQKASKVKFTCAPSAAATVIVAPGGIIGYSAITTTIQVGQTIEWDWQGSPHTVTSGTPGSPDGLFCSPNDTNCSTPNTSGNGARYRHTFTTSGTFKYFCQVHLSEMTATVQVNP